MDATIMSKTLLSLILVLDFSLSLSSLDESSDEYVLFFFMSFQESGRNHPAACGCGNTSPSTVDHKWSGHQHNVLTVQKFYLVLLKHTHKMNMEKHLNGLLGS